MNRLALTDIPVVNRALRSRWPQWLATALLLGFFILSIFAGLFGTPAGSRNFSIVFVWIVWWALLILLMVPFAGRLWCGVCPIPAPGEWLQRRALVQPRPGGKLYTLGLKWPRKLRNIWLQNFGFLMLALFSTILLTTPRVTALVLLGLMLVAVATSLMFERRTFCHYLCPVGGFIGLYSQMAPLELRVKDRQVCVEHTEKSCYTGSDDGYGCPWLVFPGSLTMNTYCGLCTECLKTCTRDNIALYLRPPVADLLRARPRSAPGLRLDEAYKGFIMLACAVLYSAVLIGPWGALKDAARNIGTLPWFGYAAAFFVFVLLVLPGLFWLAVKVGDRVGRDSGAANVAVLPPSRRFVEYAAALVPLGLAAWVAFSLSFVLVNFSYAWSVASDPMGWGWNLLGTAAMGWTPYIPGMVPFLQLPVMLSGLVVAILVSFKTAQRVGESPRAALPVICFCVVVTLGLLALYLA